MDKKIFTILLILIAAYNSRAQSEGEILYTLFHSSWDITSIATDAINTAAEAVWGASELNGGNATFTGTLTQSAANLDDWTYSNSPADKLIVKYYGGPTLEFTFTAFDGYTDGNWEDFVDRHSALQFNAKMNDDVNLNIQSQSAYSGYDILFQRKISGSINYNHLPMTVNMDHSGKKNYEVNSSYSFYNYKEECRGESSINSNKININESYVVYLGGGSSASQFTYVTTKYIACNSSIQVGTTSYKFNNASVTWHAGTNYADSLRAGIYNSVIDSHQWNAQGEVIKNGQYFGTLQFSNEVVNYTHGPLLVLNTVDGNQYLIHSLLNWWETPTEIKNEYGTVNNFQLCQNYPNPFNPSTTIKFSLPERTTAAISIYNILGEKVAELLNKDLGAGLHKIEFNASGLSNGVYFYQLKAGKFISVKKMLLLK